MNQPSCELDSPPPIGSGEGSFLSRTRQSLSIYFFVLGALLPYLPARAQSEAQVLPVVPQPQQVEWHSGRFPLTPEHTTIRVAADDTVGLMLPVQELQQTYALLFDRAPGFEDTSNRQTIRIGLPDEDDAFRQRLERLGLWPDDRIREEGYVLSIRSEEILVAANTRAGVYYGVQTLKQLLRGRRGEAGLPGLTVVDWPDLRYRGLMDDISRGPVPTLAYMKQQVRRLAEMKVNLLTYYTEHITATEQHGDFAPAAGAVSLEEWAELADYARQYHMTLVGNFQSFGHFEKILAHPQYSHLGESGRLLSPVLPESIGLLRDLYTEMVPAFDAPFFHVNSDETFDLGRGYSKARVDSLGKAVVYAEHINRMHAILDSLGVRMMLWGDIVLEHPEVLDLLPKDIIMVTWAYDPQPSFDAMIEPFQQAGFDVMIAPGVLNSYQIMPDFEQAAGNIRGFVADAVKYDAMGMLNTVWDDGGGALFPRDWYGVALAADQAWHSDPNGETYDARFSRGLYADPTLALPRTIWALHPLDALEPTDGFNEKILLQQLIPERGEQLQLSLVELDQVLAIADSAEAILAQAEPLLHPLDYEAFQFTIDLYRLLARSRIDLVAAARSYESASLLQREDPAEARSLLVDAVDLAGTLRQQWTARANDYRHLWLSESRSYALDRMLKHYGDHIGALAETENLLMHAIRDFDMGHFLPPPHEVRLAIEESSGRYFREWLMSGPLPNPDGAAGTQTDYLAAMGGEANARPQVTQEWPYDGQTYRWHRTESDQHAVVDLTTLYPQQNNDVVLYAYANIDTDQARRVRATLGSNDGIVVFLNGQRLYEYQEIRNLQIDEDEIWLPLEVGRNHLLLKITQGSGDWGFSFQLPDVTVRSRKNRYQIVD